MKKIGLFIGVLCMFTICTISTVIAKQNLNGIFSSFENQYKNELNAVIKDHQEQQRVTLQNHYDLNLDIAIIEIDSYAEELKQYLFETYNPKPKNPLLSLLFKINVNVEVNRMKDDYIKTFNIERSWN